MGTFLRRRKGGREVVRGPVTKKEYVFAAQHTITAAEVDNADVPGILAIKKKCCGGVTTSKSKPKFELLTGRYLLMWKGEIERI